MEAKVVKSFTLSKQRIVSVDSDKDVFICDINDNSKKAFFTGSRFKNLYLMLPDISREVTKASDGKKVSLKLHLGGAWYLSLSPGIHCVDFRKFYRDSSGQIKPTKVGLALNYSEFNSLMNAAGCIMDEVDGFEAISHCWHATTEELNACDECSPFK